MALFVLLIVGVVVALTWADWHQAHKQTLVPQWANGAAFASVLAISLALATSYASAWIEGTVHFAAAANSPSFWPEAGLALCAGGLAIAAMRKKRFRSALVTAAIVAGAISIGLILSF